MKVKIASSFEELQTAPWKEFAGHIELGCVAVSKGLTYLSEIVETAEINMLIDAVQQQLDAWEDCSQ
jgi:hypothetical protein